MRTILRLRWRLAAALAMPVLLLAGCTGADRSIDLTEEAVAPMPSGDQSAVSAVDMAKAMLEAGFSDTQILQDGPAIQAALATSGGAQVRSGTLVVALFVVHGTSLFVATGTHGSFTLPLAPASAPA